MGKEMNKKTGVSKLSKENLESVSGGYGLVERVDGVYVSGRLRTTGEFVTYVFDSPSKALKWARHNLLKEGEYLDPGAAQVVYDSIEE